MTKTLLTLAAAMLAALVNPAAVSADATGTVVFDNLVSAPNVPSQGFQCCGTSEIGNEIRLESDTARRAGFATVLMSSWSLHSDYPAMPSGGYAHPVTLGLYANEAAARAHTPFAAVTQNVMVPWRPEADPTCATVTAWRHANGTCYNGFAFTIVFDLRALNVMLPDQFIFGVAYDTNTWGYAPLGHGGPFESLNVGLAAGIPPTVGIDVQPDVAYWNTAHASWYTDGGATGFHIFRPDTAWSPYAVSAQFTTFAFPTDAASCKNGAWQNLVRADFTPFRNQGACVSYVNHQ